MNPDNIACNPRNNEPGVVSVYDGNNTPNMYTNIEIDYKGIDVSVDNFLNVVRQRHSPGVINTEIRNNIRSFS